MNRINPNRHLNKDRTPDSLKTRLDSILDKACICVLLGALLCVVDGLIN